MKKVIIKENDSSQRLDKFLLKAFPHLPKSLMYKAIRKKDIKLNGKRCEISTMLDTGDELLIYLNDDVLAKKETSFEFLNSKGDINVVYEDDNLLIIDKAPGILVHDDKDNHGNTLIDMIKHYLYKKGEYNPKSELSFSPALINRIDRNTGGLVMAAKNAETLRIMNQKLKDHEIEKYYLCVVIGKLSKKTGRLESNMSKDKEKNIVSLDKNENTKSKIAITEYKVLEEKSSFSLLEIKLITGRSHQIRAQFAEISHPLLGDPKYGNMEINRNMQISYQALYSYKLKFSFISDAGKLDYLNKMEFSAKNIWFMDMFDNM